MKYCTLTDISKINIVDWGKFVKNHPNGNIFQTPEFFKIYSQSDHYKPIIIVIFVDNKIQGLLLAGIQKEYFGIIGKLTSRAIIWGGPLVYSPEVGIIILQEFTKIVKNKSIYSQFRNMFQTDDIYSSFNKTGYRFENHLDIIINLEKGENILWNEIHKNRKKEIKNGIRKGLVVNLIKVLDSNILPQIYNILKNLYKKIRMPLPSYSYFQSAINVLEPIGYLKTFVAFVEGELCGFRMVLTYNGLIYDWFAASKDDFLIYRPNDVLPWEIIKWGCLNGYSKFDFGGAGKPNEYYGVREYKRKFGGEFVNFGRYEKINNKILYNVGLLSYNIWRTIKT